MAVSMQRCVVESLGYAGRLLVHSTYLPTSRTRWTRLSCFISGLVLAGVAGPHISGVAAFIDKSSVHTTQGPR